MDKLYELIRKIEVMPGIYLGAPSLENLRHFIDGYVTCRQENDRIAA
jgi:hypothetical protein